MAMPPPANPKIYHIVHFDRLPSIIADGYLWCYAKMARRVAANRDTGTTIGMDSIKQRRFNERTLDCYPHMSVGQFVPFYFCPRSVMLCSIHYNKNPEHTYRGGQEPIVHLEADLRNGVKWAEKKKHRWAFTLSNAGSKYYNDRTNLAQLGELDWDAICARYWKGQKEGKQAEFLVEHSFPWSCVDRIGVISGKIKNLVDSALQKARYRPRVEVRRDWYY